MAREFFLVPMEGTGTMTDPYRAKYSRDAAVTGSGTIRYSRTTSALLMLEATQTYLNSVAGQSDATRLATESNIDNVLSNGQVAAAKTLFEDNGIPAAFINIGDTRRQVLRAMAGLFLFSQRMEGTFGSGFWERAQAAGVSLSSTFTSFPQALKDEFLAVRDAHGWGNLGLTNQSTLREILIAVSEQFELTPVLIGGYQL